MHLRERVLRPRQHSVMELCFLRSSLSDHGILKCRLLATITAMWCISMSGTALYNDVIRRSRVHAASFLTYNI